MNAFLQKLEHSVDFWFLLVASVIFFLLRFPSFFEPYWYGDEGVYEVLGFAMRHGRMLYQGIWDNKPPLLYIIYALFDGNQPYVKFFSFFVGLAAIYFFFALGKLLFQNKKSVFFSTIFFTLFLGLPLVEGNIANAENFMILPSVAAMYITVKTIKQKHYSLTAIITAGFLLGISFLIKVVAVFDMATLFLLIGFLLVAWDKKSFKKLLIILGIFSFACAVPLLATVTFFASQGLLTTFIRSAFLSNIGYVNYANQFVIPFTKLVVPQGFLLLRLVLLLCIVIALFLKRKSISLTNMVIFLWVPFSLFSALFSGRPYTHYMLVLLGAVSLLIGLLFDKKIRYISLLVLVVTFFVLGKTFTFYNKSFAYYGNFVRFVTNQESVTAYQSFFDTGVPTDYDVAQYLLENTKPDQKIFLWTNSAQIYYLIHRLPLTRYTVAYHMTMTNQTFNETAFVLKEQKPRFIVILPNAPTFPFLMKDYVLKVAIRNAFIYEKVL